MSDEEQPVSKSKQAWNDVGDKFSNLGDGFKSHYVKDDDEKPSREAIKDAFDTVSDGLERFFSSLGSALRDEEVKKEAKSAAKAIVDALGVTVEDLGVKAKFKKREADGEDEAEEASADAADPTETLREDLES